MELIDQRTKKIMEECKHIARDHGLKFDDESLEYIVTNQDLVELSPKLMIPTMYDYWVHDVEVLKGHGKYKLYPNNPYETVINSRPPISFYNDNNPDWLNIMIFYHVLAHIDFFQNNRLFEHTWNIDFVGQALSDKRHIANLRSEHGRWVDYIIEFSRSIDNLVGYYNLLADINYPRNLDPSDKLDYYFSVFLPEELKMPDHKILEQVERYNEILETNKKTPEAVFFAEVKQKYPEFIAKYEKYINKKKERYIDLLQFIHDNSQFLNKGKNLWMKSILRIIRNTSLYFQPQIRTKILNEGWASFWHDYLFIQDKRIKGYESRYAKVNAYITSINRIGLNPYAIGLRLIEYVKYLSDKGKMSYDFQKLKKQKLREKYDKKTGKGFEAIFQLRETFSDFMLINTFITQDFVDEHQLFVVGKNIDMRRNVVQYYVKSRKAEDYKKMLIDSLYHPPKITVNTDKTNEKNLYLVHHFENKQLVKEFIPETMMGIEFLWGGQVQLETTEIIQKKYLKPSEKKRYHYQRILYTMKDKKITKTVLKKG